MDLIKAVNTYEKWIYAILIAMLMIVVIASLVDLVHYLFQALIVETPYLLEQHELVGVLGAFLLVLIGVELLETIKAYFSENAIHVEIVVLLAVIGIARKALILDPTGMNSTDFGIEMMGIGVAVVCLGAGYAIIKKAGGLTIGLGIKTGNERE
jgi:uncharacterized membrane protein (DUF373 family)